MKVRLTKNMEKYKWFNIEKAVRLTLNLLIGANMYLNNI